MQKDKAGKSRLEQVVATARQERDAREKSYRERALKMYPWICGRCQREFNRKNLHELTVHHRDHNHDNNPEDGSNWELLCLYCHDNEHARFLDHDAGGDSTTTETDKSAARQNPFAGLKGMLDDKK